MTIAEYPQKVVLPNGVRLVVDPMPGLASVALGVWVHAGARDEEPDQNGVAHLLEHMAFKGAGERTARQIAEEIEAVGGFLNAATSYPYTGFYTRVLNDHLPLALDILSDIVLRPNFDPAELEKEKAVVVQEIGEAADTPDDVLFEKLQAVSYRDQALGRPILGPADSVSNYAVSDLQGFTQRHYHAQNIVVSVAGGIGAEYAFALMEKAFGATASPGDVAKRASAYHTHGACHEPRSLEQTHLAFAMPAVGVQSSDYCVWRVLSEVLGGGMASRLFQRVREKEGRAYSVYAYLDAYDDVGTLGVYAGVDALDAAATLRSCFEEIAGAADLVTQAETARAIEVLRASLLMGLESPAARAERNAAQLFTFDRLIRVDETVDQLTGVSPGAVRCAAQQLIESDAISLAVVGPADFDKLTRVISDVI